MKEMQQGKFTNHLTKTLLKLAILSTILALTRSQTTRRRIPVPTPTTTPVTVPITTTRTTSRQLGASTITDVYSCAAYTNTRYCNVNNRYGVCCIENDL